MSSPDLLAPDVPDVLLAPPAPPPPTPDAPHAPARRDTLTPTPFGQFRPGQPAQPAPANPRAAWAWVVLGLLAGLVLLVVVLRWPQASASDADAPNVAPQAADAADAGPTAPTAAPAEVLALARAVVAFDAPIGTPIGALEVGRAYTVAAAQGDWRQIDATDAGLVWVRGWEVDGREPPAPTPVPTRAPAPLPPAPRSVPAAAPAFVPVSPPVTCLPVADQTFGTNVYLGDCCGATSAERQQCAAGLLQNAPLPAQP